LISLNPGYVSRLTLKIEWGHLSFSRRVHQAACGLRATQLNAPSPIAQILAPWVFHRNSNAIAAEVFYLNYHPRMQAFAPRVFHLNCHAREEVLAAKIVYPDRRHLAPGKLHVNLHPIKTARASERIFIELESG
jgi:hypothetical protein